VTALAAVQLAVPFIWLGMVLAISFLETPLKFRAPGITLPLGLGIGRLVFRALNAAELALAGTLTLALLASTAGDGNLGSQAVARSSGFTQTGRDRACYLMLDGRVRASP